MVDVLETLRSHTPGIKAEPLPPINDENDPFAPFWEKQGQIQSRINAIDYAVNEIQQIDDEIQSSTDKDQVKELRKQLDSKMSEINQNSTQIKGKLEQLEEMIKQEEKENPNSGEARIMQNHFHLLESNFSHTIMNFKSLQSEIKKKLAHQLIRHCRIAGIEGVDENRAEEMIDQNPDVLNQNLFQMEGTAQNQQVANIYNNIASRHQDILEIESQLNDLLDSFVQFSILIHDQGRQVDNIGQNITQAKDYVVRGTKLLEEAKADQKKGRKCLWIFVIAGCVLLVIVIILAVVIPLKT